MAARGSVSPEIICKMEDRTFFPNKRVLSSGLLELRRSSALAVCSCSCVLSYGLIGLGLKFYSTPPTTATRVQAQLLKWEADNTLHSLRTPTSAWHIFAVKMSARTMLRIT